MHLLDVPTWHLEASSGLVAMRLTGDLDALGVIASAMALAEALRASERIVILDVRATTGYETGARSAWQEHLQPLRGRIRELRVVEATAITRFGITALAMAIGVAATFDES
ncbi:MAG: hypothetical protein JW751_10205 [Polyangiaceae bacterium]|nr:hypothetical protein [Polyangiaceae bacterium]